MTETEPLPPELRDLFAHERDVPAADRVEIRQRLERSIGTPPAPAGSGLAGKKLLLVLAGVATVAAIWFARRDTSVPVAAPESPAIASAAEPEVEHAAPAREPAPPPAVEPPASVNTAPAISPAAAPAPRSSQAELLARAWQALAGNDAAATLKLLDDDRRLHPDGALSEEREAMQVQALRAAGRTDDARAHGRRFLERWPQSVHRHAVAKAVAP
jgi:hypothetical protein